MRRKLMAGPATALLLTVLSAPASGAGTTTRLTPTGFDDTAQLQAALEACSGAPAPCVIQLSAGIFYTDVLLVHGFRGRIVGEGPGRTIVRPLVGVPLRSIGQLFLGDPTLAEPYPVLLHFADGGDIDLQDFTMEFPETMQVEQWRLGRVPSDNVLLSAVMVDGGITDQARLSVSRLEIVAAAHPQVETFGSNVINAIRFEGQIRSTGPADDLGTADPLGGGSFEAHQVRVDGTGLGFALRDALNLRVEIADNRIQDTRLAGVFFGDVGGSKVTVRDNTIRSETMGTYWLRGVRPHDAPSRLRVIDNDIMINETGSGILGPGDGVVFIDLTVFDDPVEGGAIDKATIARNRIVLGVDAFDGMFVLGDRGRVTVSENRFFGPAFDGGIVLVDSQGTRISLNRFAGFGDAPDVWLTATTSGCRVIQPDAMVLDEGVGNIVR